MSWRRLQSLVLAVSFLFAFSPTANADDDAVAKAEELNDQGKKRIQQLDLEGAAEFFRQAIALSSDPRYYFNLCYTLEKSGKLVEAREACDAVSGSGNPRLESKAEQLNKKIDERLGPRPTAPSEPTPTEPPPPQEPGSGVPPPPPPPEKAPEEKPKVSYGGMVGASLASIAGPQSSSQKAGAALGALMRVPLANNYQVILEGQLVQRGGTYDEDIGTATLNTDYLDFGAAFRYAVGGGAMSYYLEAGLAISLLVRASATVTDASNDVIDIDPNVSSTDISSVFAFGYLINTGAGAVDFRLRYMIGYLNINGDPGVLERDYTNRTFLLQGGYWF